MLAATFGTKPSTVTIDAQHPIAPIAVSSLNARTVSFDVRIHRWAQNADGDVVDAAEAPGLLVVPPIFSIAPYQTTLIRVAFRGPAPSPSAEGSYQVAMTEIVGASATPRVITVPMFVRPAATSGSISYTLRRTGSTAASLIIQNASNVHLFLSKLAVLLNEKTLYKGNSSIYVLAGCTRTLPLQMTDALTGTEAELRFEGEDGLSKS
ncbi:MAG: molecular chaperone, partial [Candidatus Eremiobacteraeota bacterium]|nr:molecular chaperone [Candidatus Eremiobacteraeota bacterium]